MGANMRVSTDHFLSIGRRHRAEGSACEDYALSGGRGGSAVAVVADGCSGAHANTDIGARSACAAFLETALAGLGDPNRMHALGETFSETLLEAFRKKWITPNPTDYMTTVVGLTATDRAIEGIVFGDGCLIATRR